MKSSFSGTNGCVNIERGTMKSSFSTTVNCVNVERTSMKSSFSDQSCVNVEHVDPPNMIEVFVVSDTKEPEGPRLMFSRAEWDAFINGVKAGEFDYPAASSE